MAGPDTKDESTGEASPKKTCSRSSICVGVGVVFICCGGLLALLWSAVAAHIIVPIVQLSPDSPTHDSWITSDVPSFIDFYFFNWTNPEEVLDPEKKLQFQEIGPYRFLETRRKWSVVWNANNTVSYKQARHWYFDPAQSNGSLDDDLTTINVISMSAAYMTRTWNYFLLLPLSQVMRSRSIAVTHTISEMLFEGYDDMLLKLSISKTTGASSYDKYGLFYKRNGSVEADGVFNVGTGVDDISQVGVVKRWDYNNRTEFFPGSCGEIRGTTGERFPPNRAAGEPITIFSNSLCRSVDLEYEGETKVEDIHAFRYQGGSALFDNGTLFPENVCYCGGECLPSGVLNISACHHGAPVFTSFPHFHQADPFYVQRIEGMKPDPDKHSFYVTVEPTTGIPIDVAARLQINVLMQPYPKISQFAKLPRVFFPIMWFEQRGTITPDLAASFRLLLMLKPLGHVATVVFLVLGVGMLVTVALWHIREKRIRKRSKAAEAICMDS